MRHALIPLAVAVVAASAAAAATPAPGTTFTTTVTMTAPKAPAIKETGTVSARVSAVRGVPKGTCRVQRYVGVAVHGRTGYTWETIARGGVTSEGTCRATVRFGRRGGEQVRVKFVGRDGYASSISRYATIRVG